MTEVKWEKFKVSHVFKTSNSIPYHREDLEFTDNQGIPYVTRTSISNGLDGFAIKHSNLSINPKNVISFGAETAIFYSQPFEFITGNKMYYCSKKDNSQLSIEECLFIQQIFNSSIKGTGYGYGLGLTGSRFSNRFILLPVDDNKEPHWKYMKQFIINIMKQINIPNLQKIRPTRIKLNSVDWKEFRISDVMDVLSGVRLTTSDMTTGDIPFIGATDSNNGITNWTSDTNASTDSNVLGVNYNGSVGETFYHPYTATFSDDVKRLKIKEYNVQSKEVYLFIKTMILQQKEKYAYGYKFNGNRMKAQKIMLPITKDKDINWQFMEDYIKSISNSHLI